MEVTLLDKRGIYYNNNNNNNISSNNNNFRSNGSDVSANKRKRGGVNGGWEYRDSDEEEIEESDDEEEESSDSDSDSDSEYIASDSESQSCTAVRSNNKGYSCIVKGCPISGFLLSNKFYPSSSSLPPFYTLARVKTCIEHSYEDEEAKCKLCNDLNQSTEDFELFCSVCRKRCKKQVAVAHASRSKRSVPFIVDPPIDMVLPRSSRKRRVSRPRIAPIPVSFSSPRPLAPIRPSLPVPPLASSSTQPSSSPPPPLRLSLPATLPITLPATLPTILSSTTARPRQRVTESPDGLNVGFQNFVLLLQTEKNKINEEKKQIREEKKRMEEERIQILAEKQNLEQEKREVQKQKDEIRRKEAELDRIAVEQKRKADDADQKLTKLKSLSESIRILHLHIISKFLLIPPVNML